jgi:hypothetical protein
MRIWWENVSNSWHVLTGCSMAAPENSLARPTLHLLSTCYQIVIKCCIPNIPQRLSSRLVLTRSADGTPWPPWHCAKVLLTTLQPSAASNLPTESPGSLTFDIFDHSIGHMWTPRGHWLYDIRSAGVGKIRCISIHCDAYWSVLHMHSDARTYFQNQGLFAVSMATRVMAGFPLILVHKHARSHVCLQRSISFQTAEQTKFTFWWPLKGLSFGLHLSSNIFQPSLLVFEMSWRRFPTLQFVDADVCRRYHPLNGIGFGRCKDWGRARFQRLAVRATVTRWRHNLCSPSLK